MNRHEYIVSFKNVAAADSPDDSAWITCDYWLCPATRRNFQDAILCIFQSQPTLILSCV
jgi:hypothetical protein